MTRPDERDMPTAARTSLLHRMLVVRELMQGSRAAAQPRRCRLPAITGHHVEGCLVGITAVLGPLDLLMPAGSPAVRRLAPADTGGPAPLVVRLGDQATGDTLAGLSALFTARRASAAPGGDDVTEARVDGWDVEAVLVAARNAARLARGGHGPQLLRLMGGGPGLCGDPVAVLSGRLLRDRQMDENALDAIGRDARRVAAALLATDLRATGGSVPCALWAGSPQFLAGSAAFAFRISSVSRAAPVAKRANRRPPPGRPPR